MSDATSMTFCLGSAVPFVLSMWLHALLVDPAISGWLGYVAVTARQRLAAPWLLAIHGAVG